MKKKQIPTSKTTFRNARRELYIMQYGSETAADARLAEEARQDAIDASERRRQNRLHQEMEETDKLRAEVKEKPMATRERDTLLTIIAALCDYSAIKHQDRGAAGQIAKLTEEFGAAVTAETIRKALVRIPDALRARMK